MICKIIEIFNPTSRKRPLMKNLALLLAVFAIVGFNMPGIHNAGNTDNFAGLDPCDITEKFATASDMLEEVVDDDLIDRVAAVSDRLDDEAINGFAIVHDEADSIRDDASKGFA